MSITFWAWIITATIVFVAEILSTGWYLAPFGAGALCAAALNAADVGAGWEWIAFVGVSSVLTIVIRRAVLARDRRRED